MRTVLLAIIFYAGLIEVSWAYLNPGTSSLLLQGIAASFAVVMGTMTLGWQRIKLFVLKLFRKSFPKPTDSRSEDEHAS